MTRVHPKFIIALLEKRVREFGPITKANTAEVTRWLLAELRHTPEPRDFKAAQSGDAS